MPKCPKSKASLLMNGMEWNGQWQWPALFVYPPLVLKYKVLTPAAAGV
jgi:hypothetical protein